MFLILIKKKRKQEKTENVLNEICDKANSRNRLYVTNGFLFRRGFELSSFFALKMPCIKIIKLACFGFWICIFPFENSHSTTSHIKRQVKKSIYKEIKKKKIAPSLLENQVEMLFFSLIIWTIQREKYIKERK